MGVNRLQEREPVPGRSSHVDRYLSLQPLQEKAFSTALLLEQQLLRHSTKEERIN